MRSFEDGFFRRDFYPREEKSRSDLKKELSYLEDVLSMTYEGPNTLYYKRRYSEITGREFTD